MKAERATIRQMDTIDTVLLQPIANRIDRALPTETPCAGAQTVCGVRRLPPRRGAAESERFCQKTLIILYLEGTGKQEIFQDFFGCGRARTFTDAIKNVF